MIRLKKRTKKLNEIIENAKNIILTDDGISKEISFIEFKKEIELFKNAKFFITQNGYLMQICSGCYVSFNI
jgi:hypothetical protein